VAEPVNARLVAAVGEATEAVPDVPDVPDVPEGLEVPDGPGVTVLATGAAQAPPEAVETLSAWEQPDAVEPWSATAAPEEVEPLKAPPLPEHTEPASATQVPDATDPLVAWAGPLPWLVISLAPAGAAMNNSMVARLPRASSTEAPLARFIVFMVLPSCRDSWWSAAL